MVNLGCDRLPPHQSVLRLLCDKGLCGVFSVQILPGWAPRLIAFSCLKKVAELTMVDIYSRYNYSIHGVYKQT